VRQQINLYQPIFRKQEKIFSAVTLLQASLIVMAGMLLLYGYNFWQTQNIRLQLAQLEKQRNDNAAQVAQLERQYPEPVKSTALERRVAKEKKRLEARSKVVATLTMRAHSNTDGFSSHLEGLAKQRLPRLWLSQVTLFHGGTDVTLKGSTYDEEQVPQFLQRLSSEEGFGGTGFSSFLMTRPEEKPNQLDFQVSSLPVEEKKP
jgi:hypothetical protein